MTGSIRDYTTNFKFIIPEFNIATWHDYIEENFRSIDALFHNLFGINGFSGIWKTNSQYTAGQVLFVGEDNGSMYEGRLLKIVNDTNTGGFNTFSEAIKAHPKDYELYADASSAQIFSELARDWANKTNGTIITPEGDDTGEYSAKKYAQDSQSSAIDSEYFKNLAQTCQEIAQSAATDAETSARNSEISAQNALVSEQNSKTSETNAKTSEQNALTSEQNAKSSEDNAKIYETNAANSVETQTNNFNTYNDQLLSTTSTGVLEITNTKAASVGELDSKLFNALNEINSKTDTLNKTMITNCLTYVLQNINYDFVGDTLTFHSGSRFCVPYGTTDLTNEHPIGSTFIHDNFKVYKTYFSDGKFFVFVEAVNDVLHVIQGNTTEEAMELICLTTNSGTDWGKNGVLSGTTAPTGGGYQYYTNDNFVKKHTDGVPNPEVYSFPVMTTKKETGIPKSIDQIFNSFGYIGSILFAFPGFKGICPNYRNADGSLKNIEFVTDKVLIHPFTSTIGAFTGYAAIQKDGSDFVLSYDALNYWTYNADKNIFEGYNETTSFCYLAKISTDSTGKITSFIAKTLFQVVDFSSIAQHVVVSTLPANPHTNTFYYIPS